MRSRIPRIVAVVLVLGLLALGSIAHVHAPDARAAASECSLCASGGLAVAAGPAALLPAVALPGDPVFPGPRLACDAIRCAAPAIRGPPARSPA